MIEGHGDDLYRCSRPITANFSSNLTNWIDPTPLKTYLCEHIGETVSTYPEPQPYTLEARMAETLRLQPDQVCVTNGATEAIYLIAQSFAGGCSAVLQPTFSEYADACRIHGHRIISLFRLPENGKLPKDLQMLWLCNPNNPTGQVIDKARLVQLVENNPQVMFVIDQSYESFTQKQVLTAREAAGMPNVLLIHSLTKRYSMPGLRLGYLTGNASLLRHLRTHRMPWSVNSVALLAGMFILEHPETMPFDLSACLEEASRLQSLLCQTRCIDVWDTDTHFMLARLRTGNASALKDYLIQEHGLLIRNASNFEGLDATYFRISTQRPECNTLLLNAIKQWLEI